MKEATLTILFNHFWNDSELKIVLTGENGTEATFDEAEELLSGLLEASIFYGSLPDIKTIKVIDLTKKEESEESGEVLTEFINYLMDRV